MTGADTSITVLCVNDSVDLLDLLATGLRAEEDGFEVLTATGVTEALDVYRTTEVDCIVSDYHMPDRNGVEFLEAVRADDPEFPFVMFTETGSETVASESIQAGVTDYVVRETVGNQYAFLAEKIARHVGHRRTERRAARTNRQLRELSAATDDVLFMFSADWTTLQFVNAAYETLFGDSPETLRADPTSFLAHVNPQDADRVTRAMERVADGHPQQVEYRVQQTESIQIWVESQCKPVRDEAGDIESVVGFTREITDRKHREQELASQNEKLDQFAATVAHDLRNPLGIAHGHLELAEREFDSEHVDTSLDAVSRMSQLIDELLTLAKEGTEIDERTQVDLRTLVDASTEDLVMTAATVTVEDSLLLLCDVSRLKEAVGNLLRNAVEHGSTDPRSQARGDAVEHGSADGQAADDATDQDGASVHVTVGTLDEADGFYFEDDGPGIPPEEREHVFDRSYTTADDGTGFGLAIVDQIVTAHGWHIEATAGTTGGARFEVTDVDLVT